MTLVITRTWLLLALLCPHCGHSARPQKEAVGIEPGHLLRFPHDENATSLPAAGRHHDMPEGIEKGGHLGLHHQQHRILNRTALKQRHLTSQLELLHNTFDVGGILSRRKHGTKMIEGAEVASAEVPKTTWIPAFFWQAALVGLIVLILTVIGALNEYSASERPLLETDKEDAHEPPPECIGEDLFGLVLSSMVRNIHAFAVGTNTPKLRLLHIITCISLLVISMMLQVYILYFVHKHVAAEVEEDIRRDYDIYEIAMYGNNVAAMDVTPNGYHRGRSSSLFNPELFAKLDDAVKKTVCHMPLSQPCFFATILMVWTLTCVTEIRPAFEHLWRFMINTPTVDTMAKSLKFTHEDNPDKLKSGGSMDVQEFQKMSKQDSVRFLDVVQGVIEVEIIGLTVFMKVFVAAVQILPRIIMGFLLLWLGCIWLCATTDFSNLMSNVVALAFIVQLKDLIFSSVVPKQAQLEAAATLVKPLFLEGKSDMRSYFGSFIWLILSVMWIVLFFHIQTVLPMYKWDVRGMCAQYLYDEAHPESQAI